MLKKIPTLACAALITLPAAAAASDAEIAEMKRTLEAMKTEYEARIQALEKRIAQAEKRTENTPAPAAAQSAAGGKGSTSFNPAVSLSLQGSAASYSRDPEEWSIPGFQTGGHAGLKPEGLSVTETELTLSANVDHLFYGQASIGLHEEAGGETEIDVEEAYIDTLALPAGFGVRFGRFYPEIGYLNTHHTHAWDFADAPLTQQAFLGQQYNDDGVRLSWIAPTETYLELGAEALRGEHFPAGGDGSDFLGGAQNYFARIGQDVNEEHSFRLGLSHLRAEPVDRTGGHDHGHEDESGHHDETFSFSGNSNLTVLDAVWKWAPGGNFRDRGLTLRGEYFYREEDGAYTLSTDDGSALLPYDGTQEGFYLEGIYQFAPRWRAGLRYARLTSDNDLAVTDNTTGEAPEEIIEESGLIADQDPYMWSAMLDWSPSEFSRLRLQYNRDYTLPEPDDQVFLQYIMSLGAHGAHQY